MKIRWLDGVDGGLQGYLGGASIPNRPGIEFQKEYVAWNVASDGQCRVLEQVLRTGESCDLGMGYNYQWLEPPVVRISSSQTLGDPTIPQTIDEE